MRQLVSVVGLVAVFACGTSAERTRELQSPGLSDLDYTIYAAVVLREGHEAVIADSTYPLEACQPSEPHCWIAAVPAEFKAAATDYLSQNQTRVLMEERFPATVHAHLQRKWSGSRVRGCRDTPRLTLSRIGFNRDSSKAVVAYETVVGQGPYPGCGYMAGYVLTVARTPNGVWMVDRQLIRWIT